MVERSTISFLQHNTHRTKEAQTTALQLASEKDIDIILLQEPWTFQPEQNEPFISVSHPRYTTLFPARDIYTRPRVLIYISKTTSCSVTVRSDIIQDPDIQIIEVIAIKEPFLIVNLYNEKQLGSDLLDTTVDRTILNKLPLGKRWLLVGDFNLNDPYWNPIGTVTQASSRLVSWLQKQEAIQLIDYDIVNNEGGTFFRSNLLKTSIIDLTFIKGFKNILWEDWEYAQHTGSDHEAITFKAILDETLTTNPIEKFNLKKTDWTKFREVLLNQGKLLQYNQRYTLEERTKRLEEAILLALTLSTPYLRVNKSASKPWWSKELKTKRQQLNKTAKQLKKNQTSISLNKAYRTIRNSYFQAITKAKRDHWINFLNSAEKLEVFKARKYTKAATSTVIPILTKGDQVAKSFKEKCDLILETLFPGKNEVQVQPISYQASRGTVEWPAFGIIELERALYTTKNDSAPGSDKIGYKVIKEAYKTIPKPFQDLYRDLFNEGYHPIRWRQAIGIVIPKIRKKDYNHPKSYRVISLLNCLGKLLEKVVATRLSYLANIKEDFLHPSQLGGRKQRSAVDTALLLLHYIQKELAKHPKQVVSTVLVDIKNAFNQMRKNKSILSLIKVDLPISVQKWVECFFTDRRIQLAFEGQIQQPTNLDCGAPQGSPVSPILFLLYIREVIGKYGLQLSYIDDISISVSSRSDYENCITLQRAVRQLSIYEEEKGIQFDPEKTELIHFSRTRKPLLNPIIIGGKGDLVVRPKPYLRWLGIWFDFKLDFKTHREKRLGLAISALQQIQKLAYRSKGLSVTAFKLLYTTVICPIADYGTELWYKEGNIVPNNHYQKIQTRALYKLCGAFLGSPYRALEVEASLLPVSQRLTKRLYLYMVRNLAFQEDHQIKQTYIREVLVDRPISTSTTPIGNELARLVPQNTQLLYLISRLQTLKYTYRIEEKNYRWIPPWKKPPKIESIILQKKKSKSSRREFEDLISCLEPRSYMIYTDGSKEKTATSAAVCLYYNNRLLETFSTNLGPSLEIADAESVAILKAIQIASRRLEKGNEQVKTIYICIDSQTAILRLRNNYFHTTQQIGLFTSKLAIINVKLTVVWCPSHIGIEGNELADKLAKKAL